MGCVPSKQSGCQLRSDTVLCPFTWHKWQGKGGLFAYGKMRSLRRKSFQQYAQQVMKHLQWSTYQRTPARLTSHHRSHWKLSYWIWWGHLYSTWVRPLTWVCKEASPVVHSPGAVLISTWRPEMRPARLYSSYFSHPSQGTLITMKHLSVEVLKTYNTPKRQPHPDGVQETRRAHISSHNKQQWHWGSSGTVSSLRCFAQWSHRGCQLVLAPGLSTNHTEWTSDQK